jgi:hypothetical protein
MKQNGNTLNCCKLFVLSLVVCTGGLSSTSPADAAVVRAEPAYRFVNSVGVATHFSWKKSVYRTKYANVKSALKELGIRHARDQIGNTSALRTYRDLYGSLGLMLTGVVDTRTGHGASWRLDNSRIQGQLNKIAPVLGVDAVAAIEGPNEYNNLERFYGYKNWPRDLRSYQKQLFERVNATRELRSIPVLAPSLGDPMQKDFYDRLGNLSSMTDRGNGHVYPNWLSFTQKIRDVMPYLKKTTPQSRVVITETNWHDALNSGTQYVTEDVQAKYAARAMIEFASNPQIERAFFYQLIDDVNDPVNRIMSAHKGLLDYNLHRNQKYYAIRNMMHILCDDPLKSAPETLDYKLSGNLADVRTELYQKRNRTLYLLIWLEKQSFGKGRRINNGTQAVNLRFNQAIDRVRLYRPSDPGSDLTTGNHSRRRIAGPSTLDLKVTDDVTILEITRRGVPKAHTSTSCEFKAS